MPNERCVATAASSLVVCLGVMAAGVSNAQPLPTKPPGGLDPATMIGSTPLSALLAQAAAAIPHAMIGAPSGVAPLNTQGVVPRSSLPANTLNLATQGSALTGAGGDAATIASIYAAAPADSILTVPVNGRLPGGLAPPTHPGGPVEWNLLGNNYQGTTGTNEMENTIGDGDVTQSFWGGHWNLMRHIESGNPGNTEMFLYDENSSNGYTPLYGAVYGGVPALQINAQNDAGANGSVIGEQINLNVFDQNAFADENVGYSVNAYKTGEGSSWQFSGQTQDNTGRPPQSFSALGLETDIVANGPDAAASMYDPRQSDRWFIYLAPKENPTGSWAAGTAVTAGSLITATPSGTGSQPTVYIATTGGTTAATAPTWPTSGTVTDGGVTWTYGEPYAMSVGAGIWLDNGESNTTSYSAGFATNGRFDDAPIDLSGAVLTQADGNNTGAAIRIAANQPIDLSGGLTQATQNNHFLEYSTYAGQNALVYNNTTGTLFSVADSTGAPGLLGQNGYAKFVGPIGIDSAGNQAGITGGYQARGLNVAWNVSNGGQETDLVGGQGGYAFYVPTSAGAISAPAATIGATGTLTAHALAAGVNASVTAAGTTQATATVLTAQDSVITTCASGAGVELPPAVIGEHVRVLNRGVAACSVYPPNGGQIENAGTNAAIIVAAGSDAMLEAFTATQWYK